MVLVGWAKIKNRDMTTEGLSLLRSGAAAYRATDRKPGCPLFSPSSPGRTRWQGKSKRP